MISCLKHDPCDAASNYLEGVKYMCILQISLGTKPWSTLEMCWGGDFVLEQIEGDAEVLYDQSQYG